MALPSRGIEFSGISLNFHRNAKLTSLFMFQNKHIADLKHSSYYPANDNNLAETLI